ncbi:hypothetical protein F5Y15DRAFT_409540 [Xylariaceae sp. FL0016]|nr:hypothetical protein F5Y15DRAFT_409540 [Xylariaceae sp. FL0016]
MANQNQTSLTVREDRSSISDLNGKNNSDGAHYRKSPRSRQNMSQLLLLPQELWDEIAQYLHPQHLLVLALVNKELMRRFMYTHAGEAAINANTLFAPYRALGEYISSSDVKAKVRGAFLSLVDYDLLDLVYCYKCKKMHDPFVTFQDREFATKKSSRCADSGWEQHMPPRAIRKLLRCITKRRIHGAEYRYLLQQVNNTMTTYQGGVLSQTTLRLRYRNELQLLRRQQVISSIDKTPQAMWLFRKQLGDVQPPARSTVPKVLRICNHLSWAGKYDSLVSGWLNSMCECDADNDHAHDVKCFTLSENDLSKVPGHAIAVRLSQVSSDPPIKANPTDVPNLLGNIFACDKCTTDYSLDVVPLQPPFHWGFVMTRWLDFGRLDFSPNWDSHRHPHTKVLDRKPQTGVCEAFEDLECRLDYKPVIRELDRQRMKNYGWGERAASGMDRYMDWSNGHAADRMTGKFSHPDPLDEADY